MNSWLHELKIMVVNTITRDLSEILDCHWLVGNNLIWTKYGSVYTNNGRFTSILWVRLLHYGGISGTHTKQSSGCTVDPLHNSWSSDLASMYLGSSANLDLVSSEFLKYKIYRNSVTEDRTFRSTIRRDMCGTNT